MAKVLMKGNEALAEGAIRAGCKLFFGYPITPQSEIPEYLSRRLPEVGGCYLQAESEVAASNMLYGAAGVGERVFTSSSSPGISLMAEGLSYIAGAQLPVVVLNMVRGGPGLGGILPAQSDYLQATKGLGHGDFRLLVLAPSTVQEAADLIVDAFDLADKYRNPVMILGDGMLGQMMEPVEFKDRPKSKDLPPKTWAATGLVPGKKKSIINSLYLDPLELEANSWELKAKYDAMARDELRWEQFNCEGEYDVLIVAYGSMARICKTTIELLKKRGVSVGLFRPITVFPYPYKQLSDAAQKAKMVFCVEMSTGQMLDDVKIALEGSRPIHFYGRTGGIVPSPEEVLRQVERIRNGEEVDKVWER
ncbi:MAG: 3-methyl-2-oxobutanoate dehydrogenase subunit beta [Candidatus Coatesbacteria bacterium]|nr:MAG: 3-methyl-2-oxobutanoate dehydrogenase subunit beta [Candidatus Coatesbacteria bacterium]